MKLLEKKIRDEPHRGSSQRVSPLGARKQILNDTRGLSGVYMIINKTTKDYYIGSASTGRFYARFCNHVIYFRGSKIVKLAIKKYDLKNFAFVVLDLYPYIVTHELLHLEDKYLKLLVPNYNILTEAVRKKIKKYYFFTFFSN
jgi:group I intron endonuclease